MRNDRTKKRILTLALLALVVACAVAAVQAFTVRTVEADNVITFGSVKMRILETQLVDGAEQTVPDGYTVEARSGLISRIVRVQNVGNDDCYVRVRPVLTAVAQDGTRSDVTDQAAFAMNANDWTEGEDGWWYCNQALAPESGSTTGQASDSVTEPLMTGLELPDAQGMGAGSSLVLTLDAQAVQAEHNAEDPMSAQGWPANSADEGRS